MKKTEKDGRRFITPSGALLMAVCFFLPWVRACGVEVSGADIASKGDTPILWLILAVSVITIGVFFIFDGQNKLNKIKPIVIIGSIISLLIIIIKYFQLKNSEIGAAFTFMYGFVGTVFGSIISLIGASFLQDYSVNLVSLNGDNRGPDQDKTLSTDNKSDDSFCGNCGEKIRGQDLFCPKCGKKKI
ncbi:MAG: zinc ribbon domain-containing protein [Deltaproteobacteria bacterium]|nr:zinc ribbon domain-containing protein [Deltaproteobacteria bacterium]